MTEPVKGHNHDTAADLEADELRAESQRWRERLGRAEERALQFEKERDIALRCAATADAERDGTRARAESAEAALRVAREAWAKLKPFCPEGADTPQWRHSEHYRAARDVDAALAPKEGA